MNKLENDLTACEFSGCPFPRVPRKTACQYHIATFGLRDYAKTPADDDFLAANDVPRKAEKQ